MASADVESFKPVLAALSTMQSNAERSQKSQAHEYLEVFQKSVCIIPRGHRAIFVDHIRAVARSMEDNLFYSIRLRYSARAKVICGNNTEGQSTFPSQALKETTLTQPPF